MLFALFEAMRLCEKSTLADALGTDGLGTDGQNALSAYQRMMLSIHW